MELFPDLPADVGFDCLIRVPYDSFSTVSSVCQSWTFHLRLPEFWHRRKSAGLTRRVIVISQERVVSTQKLSDVSKHWSAPVYRLTLCDPETGYWRELPPIPDYSNGLPMFCQLAGVGYNLVVIGGWHPTTWIASKAVFIYSFVSGTWRRGADMPGGPRSFFSCATSNDNRTVLVAGGHDDTKIALRSAMMYEVDNDKWVLLPDMAEERDECTAVFHGGKFHVIGGYRTQTQGRFEKNAEAFDAVNRKWDPVPGAESGTDFLDDAATCPRNCVAGDGEGGLYSCQSEKVMGRVGSAWQVVAAVPAEIGKMCFMSGWGGGKLVVMGAPRFGEPNGAYELDLKSGVWRKVEAGKEFTGHVQSGCCMEI